MDPIKISQLPPIGNTIPGNTLVPVVNMTGTPDTQKATIANIANAVLSQAGNLYISAGQANVANFAGQAGSVSNAMQPNITSVGILSNLTVEGLVNLGNVSNLVIYGGSNNQVLTTDGNGVVFWDDGGTYGNSEVANYLPTFTGNVGANWVIADYFMGNAHNLTFIPSANINGAVPYASTANSVSLGNVSGIGNIANINLDGSSSNVLYGNGVFAPASGGANVGNFIFANTTMSTPNEDIMLIQTTDNNSDLRTQMRFNPDFGQARMAARSAENNTNYTNTSWTIGEYTSQQVNFVDAPAIVAFLNTGAWNNGVDKTFSINGGNRLSYQGYSAGGNNATVYTDVSASPDPTTVTSIDFYYQLESYFEIDEDDGDMGIYATGLTIRIDNDQTDGPDIFIRSGDDITIQAKSKTLGSESEGGDINIYAGAGAGDDGAGNVSSTGGDIQIYAGAGGFGNSGTGSEGGFTRIRAGTGGDAGVSSIAGTGGYVEISAGSGGYNNGNIQLGAIGGHVDIYAGQTTLANTVGGNVSIRSGEGGDSAIAGNVEIIIPASGPGGGGTWTFDGNGLLTLPNGDVQIGTQYGSPSILASNVAFGIVTQGNGMSALQWVDDVSNTSQISAVYVNDPAGNIGDIHIRTGNIGNANIWKFNVDGNLILPNGNSVIQSIANSSLDPLIPNVSTMTLTPDANYNSQVLVLDPTAPGHIHLRAFASSNIDEPSANIFLGGENTAFEITQGANNVAKIHSGGNTWTFTNAGDLQLASGNSVISSLPNNAGDSSGLSTLNLYPDNSTGDDRYLIIDPTGPAHLHLRAGGAQDASNVLLYLGGEQTYVQIDDGYHRVSINSYDVGNATGYNWRFDYTGNLVLPTNGSIIVDGGDGVIGPVSDDLVISWDNEEIRLVSVQGSIEMQAEAAFRVQTNYDGANVLYASRWEFNQNEIVNISNNFSIVSEAGNLNLSGGRDGVNSGNTTISAVATGVAVSTWTFDNTGNLTLPGNTFAVNYANGTQVSLGGGSYGDSNVVTLLGSFGSNSISTTGNVTANNFSGNTNSYTIGYLDIPQIPASNTTLAATDGGKHYYSTTAGNLTLTIPNNATTSFATGTAISIVVQAAGNVLVNAASGVTLYMAGSSTAGNRVVGTYGMATLMKVASDTWFINGTGVY